MSALLLLHGLGGTGAVWDALRAELPGVEVVAPDLPGHGAAPPLDDYSFESLAAAVAADLDPDRSYSVLGHSLGGVVGLVLAGGAHGVRVDGVIGLGTKVVWSADDLARAAALAAKPARVLPTYEEAADRHLALSGLRGLAPLDSRAVVTGVVPADGGWRPALDPRAFAVGAPDLPALLAAARAPVVLARGEHDPMVTGDQLRAVHPVCTTLSGSGHCPHVETPSVVADLVMSCLTIR